MYESKNTGWDINNCLEFPPVAYFSQLHGNLFILNQKLQQKSIFKDWKEPLWCCFLLGLYNFFISLMENTNLTWVGYVIFL